ncbi:hypothetical protein P691DRAFT_537790 [Macrolepiota fuliginosa MF-IS2]|uniref:Uncharacterized protein n=1 Tax=Macrolepiota fuliginosa MF-IS2 TaxID=1400762 RepID=A0A9P5XEV5_9AGAR|nr:hypothetical protein P691DRAFT_537790 [Macrolepiota fuliginosa MF-IS2]
MSPRLHTHPPTPFIHFSVFGTATWLPAACLWLPIRSRLGGRSPLLHEAALNPSLPLPLVLSRDLSQDLRPEAFPMHTAITQTCFIVSTHNLYSRKVRITVDLLISLSLYLSLTREA